jgi:hypothetical protein
MPELPEVETAVRRLRPAVVGRRLVVVRTHHPVARRALPDTVAAQLVGRRVTAVERLGKHQHLVLDDGSVLHAHFRMNGDWHTGPATAALPAYARVSLVLDDDTAVALVDSRALATVVWRPAGAPAPALGPDAADPASTPPRSAAALRGRRAAIKPRSSTSASSPASATSTRRRRCGAPGSTRGSSPAGSGPVAPRAPRRRGPRDPRRRARRRRPVSGRRGARPARRLRPGGRALPPLRRRDPPRGAGRPLHLLLPACQRR